jgi:GTPase SAR1 family protein
MTPDPKDKATGQNKPTQKEDTPSATEDTTSATEDPTSSTEDTTSKRHHPVQAIPKEKDIKLPTMVSTEKTQSAKIDEKIKPEKIVKSKHVNTSKQAKIKSKMTRKEINKQMEKSLKRGEYKMKVGRLIFWDFGGQYVYYTTHQTFMTYRALFLVVFDGSKDLYDEVSDVLCFPGQHGTPTPAGIHCLR